MAGGESPVYRIYGLAVACELPFAARLARTGGPPDLTVEGPVDAPPVGGWEESEPVYASPRRTRDGEPAASLYRGEGWELLRYSGLLDFFFLPGRIVVQALGKAPVLALETRLLGPVLAYWLERSGVLALHAAAVEIEGRAVVLLADNGGGKSSLGAAALAAGHALLSDDLVAVEEGLAARPGYPEMRLWPAAATHFLGSLEGLSRVDPHDDKLRVEIGTPGFGRFRETAAPIAALVVPRWRQTGEDRASFELLRPSAALMELVRHSYSPYIVEGAGLQPERLRRLSELVAAIPTWRLDYPAGYDHLAGVVEALARRLAGDS